MKFPSLIQTSSFLSSVSHGLQGCDIPGVKQYTILFTRSPPTIDGNLDDDAWQKAPWTEDFGDILGPLSGLVSSDTQTKTKMLWDDKYLYVGARLSDPFIFAKTDRAHGNEALVDNTFEIFLDTDRTNHNYKRIQINPLGVSQFLEYGKPPADGGQPMRWDIGPQFRSQIYNSTLVGLSSDPSTMITSLINPSNFWTVEWAIPIEKFRRNLRKRGDGQSSEYSNFQFMRSGWPPENVSAHKKSSKKSKKKEKRYLLSLLDNLLPTSPFKSTWTPQYTEDAHNPEWWGQVEFSREEVATPPKPDPQYLTRFVLMQIYRAQQEHFREQGRYTANLDELKITGPKLGACTAIPEVMLSESGLRFEAVLPFQNQPTPATSLPTCRVPDESFGPAPGIP
ncbi:CBD9-like protein [Basidiobolus meristosporus CBS 931.73]|uniref:CBD9-like protein n=1 Tax=Basidiobolus meristosporus CBS 931.73 TaxID=1314790 RepID=A0A1Y1Z7U7_9FUNG|nr:CBD9-like protein [Basidiobolus meristosporus CBS 931.73]|eukprot:ORY05885.1 CBD9-like protein [Basidiobolus meristosporus CBS 931.73]